MFAARTLLPLLLALAACSVVNKDHCANLDGDATCRERDAATPYCSLCLPDNNGCFTEPPLDACHAVTVPLATSTGDASTFASTSDTTATTTPVDPPTTGSGTDSAIATSDTSSSTGDSTSSTTATTTSSTTDETTSSTTGTTADTSTGTTTDLDTDTTAGTTMTGPVCGDGMIEDDEVCDGKNLGGETCKLLLPGKWGGGTLTCNGGCKSFNDTKCCVGVGQTCGGLLAPDPKLPCCPELTCTAEGGKHVCKS